MTAGVRVGLAHEVGDGDAAKAGGDFLENLFPCRDAEGFGQMLVDAPVELSPVELVKV